MAKESYEDRNVCTVSGCFSFSANSPVPPVRKTHRCQCRHRPIGYITPIHTLHTSLCLRYQLFGNVHLKRVNSSAVNTTIRERIPLSTTLLLKVYFLTSNLHLFFQHKSFFFDHFVAHTLPEHHPQITIH